MKCEICKRNQASFYRFIPVLERQAPVCVACLSKMLILKTDVFDYLGDSLAQEYSSGTESMRSLGKAVCTNCGFEFDDYFETGRFGCVKCYDVFHDKIVQIVGEIHGRTHHNGSRLK